jgi:hypothetical protein
MHCFKMLTIFISALYQKIGIAHEDEAASLTNNSDCLNSIMQQLHEEKIVSFADASLFEGDLRYYEQIIFEALQVPTRSNWHDFFNGLIWSQFPNTKLFFNHAHVQQIKANGFTKRRSPIRDRLTHFDECGLVLFTTCDSVEPMIRSHSWQSLFVEEQNKWDTQILPVIFGHAIWEMLLEPFIGLTAKATVIHITASNMGALRASNDEKASLAQRAHFYKICDKLLLEHFEVTKLLEIKKPWLPLPLLGIPGWSPFAQTKAFYDDTSYFMPKRE